MPLRKPLKVLSRIKVTKGIMLIAEINVVLK